MWVKLEPRALDKPREPPDTSQSLLSSGPSQNVGAEQCQPGLSTEQLPVSAYVGSSKNLKDLKDLRLEMLGTINPRGPKAHLRSSFSRSNGSSLRHRDVLSLLVSGREFRGKGFRIWGSGFRL